ncbi:hypothetical protein ACL02O_09975 [Micromonospora sp. MS34]
MSFEQAGIPSWWDMDAARIVVLLQPVDVVGGIAATGGWRRQPIY